MMATCKSKKLIAVATLLLSLVMMLSIWTISASATEAGTAADTSAPVESNATTEADTEATTGSETTATTGAETKAETKAETGAETKAETEAETEDPAVKKEKTTRGLINLGVGAVILIVLVILCITYRAKIPGWWKALKSECGKISWCSKDKLKKNTIVVVIIILAITLAVALMDYAFSTGLLLLKDLVDGIRK